MKVSTLTIKDAFWDFRWLRRWYAKLGGDGSARAKVFLGVLAVAVLIIGLFGFLLIQDIAASGSIFAGVSIDGQPVGGLSRKAARQMVEQRVGTPLQQPLVVASGQKQFKLDPASIGFKVDQDKMVSEAYWAGQGKFVVDRMFRRLLGRPVKVNVPVLYSYDQQKLAKFVTDVAGAVDYEATDARIDVSSGSPAIKAAREGLRVKQKETTAAIKAGLAKADRKVEVVTEPVKPQVLESAIDKIVIIKQAAFRLSLYNREDEIDSFPIAVGMPAYPTPNGRFHVTYKERNPTWLPTSEWAKDKQGIPQPPGPDNPLGGYWMDLGGGIGIHASPFVNSIGTAASHGCIRMLDADAATVFNTVKVGTPVFIVL